MYHSPKSITEIVEFYILKQFNKMTASDTFDGIYVYSDIKTYKPVTWLIATIDLMLLQCCANKMSHGGIPGYQNNSICLSLIKE